VREWAYPAGQIDLFRGAEMGRFLLGSTVVLLFPRGPLTFNLAWTPGRAVRLGEAMADRS
jgi:phosphatidylserine decarboxylase